MKWVEGIGVQGTGFPEELQENLGVELCGFRFICLEGLVLVGRGGGGERAWEGEYGANTVYTCMQMEK
jgi:hypothetical protein